MTAATRTRADRATVPAIMPVDDAVMLILTGARALSDVNTVRKAILRLTGVTSVALRPAGSGVVHLHVRYTGVVPFEVHLAELQRRGFVLPHGVALLVA